MRRAVNRSILVGVLHGANRKIVNVGITVLDRLSSYSYPVYSYPVSSKNRLRLSSVSFCCLITGDAGLNWTTSLCSSSFEYRRSSTNAAQDIVKSKFRIVVFVHFTHFFFVIQSRRHHR